MKIADWLRGAANIAIADVEKVFTAAIAGVSGSALPAPLKLLLHDALGQAHDYVTNLEGLAGSLVGEAVADAVDDITTLLMNTAGVLSSGKNFANMSVAEKTVLMQTWTAMRAQGDTLLAQLTAGLALPSVSTTGTSGTSGTSGIAAQSTAPLQGGFQFSAT